MSDKNSAFPLMISVVVMDANQLRSVYALLGGAAIAVAQSAPGNETASAPPVMAERSEPFASTAESAPSLISSTATTSASPSETVETDESLGVDAHGWPWSSDLHASTKSKTKDGLWRMKVGVTRPDPKPGFPADNADTGTSQETATPSATSQTATAPESAPTATSTDEEDEFAAFRTAAAASDAADQAAAASVPPRQYSDADLGALCNQAAVKLGDPNPVKEIIASFTPEGQVAHSRNIPSERRAEFVKKVEERAGIEFAG